jgi:phosphate transport system substrate-binding protein
MASGRRIALIAAAGALALGLAACGSSKDTTTVPPPGAPKGGAIRGAGATFPQPVYAEWAARYKDATGTIVNYQAIGSVGGISEFTARTVDFGASDSAMTDREIKAARKNGAPVHIPTVAGAVVLSYNVRGAPRTLKLDGRTIASIFLGDIKVWNAPAIARQNRGQDLPATAITVCRRAEPSGTTKLFTTFLADESRKWRRTVGSDTTVPWPTGTAVKGNGGVAACVKQNDGAIGYVEQAYALENNLVTASVRNRAGNYIAPTLESTTAAVQGLRLPADLRFSAINTPARFGYPIASSTFILVYRDMCKAGVSRPAARRVKGWLDYVLGPGQQIAPQVAYAPESPAVNAAAKAKVGELVCNDGPLGG